MNFVLYEDEAYVEYNTTDEANEAIERLNGTKYMDSRLLVEWSQINRNRKRFDYHDRMNRKKDVECYNCRRFGHY